MITFTVSDALSCYEVLTDTWKTASGKLNIARYLHSSCILGDVLYAVCGYRKVDNEPKLTKSIEWINLNTMTRFEIMKLPLSKRIDVLVVPINMTEILMFGGNSGPEINNPNNNDSGIDEDLSDGYILNTKTMKAKKVFENDHKLSMKLNQCAVTRVGEIVGLVRYKLVNEKNPSENEALAVIKYKKGDDGVKILYSTHESRSADVTVW